MLRWLKENKTGLFYAPHIITWQGEQKHDVQSKPDNTSFIFMTKGTNAWIYGPQHLLTWSRNIGGGGGGGGELKSEQIKYESAKYGLSTCRHTDAITCWWYYAHFVLRHMRKLHSVASIKATTTKRIIGMPILKCNLKSHEYC